MKVLVVFLAAVALCAGGAIPNVPKDNSHYVEGKSRYVWIPDDNGEIHLEDLQAPLDEETIRQAERNGANNEYWLFTRRNPTSRQIITHNNINSLRNSFYLTGRPLMVLVHGFNGRGSSSLNPAVTSAYLAVADANVIVVDWNRGAGGAYSAAVRNVASVGQHLGNFLVWLVSNTGNNWNNVHLVGFSLGAHVVGNAGRQAGRRPIRITGLDPAGPQWGNNAQALNRNDGQYVEAIHTNGGNYGINNVIANADFFPNGGRRQPGCSNNSCYHSRAHELYASSVRTNHFQGRLCNNQNDAANNRCTGAVLRMGNSDLQKRGNGIYGLTTGGSWPF